jgi:hypothetical protein
MWTVTHNGTTKSLEEWQITNVVRTLSSFAVSTVSFDVSAEFDADDVFAHGSEVIIHRDLGDGPVQWFVGRVDQTPRTANGRYEGHGYVLVDAWWHLETLVYQIVWKELANPLEPSEGLTEKLYSDIILNLSPAGTLVTTKDQIRAVLEYATEEAEAPFQIGTIDLPDLYPPTSQVSARMCSEIIENQRRFTPDAVSWFDYETAPPTLHIKRRSALTRVVIPASETIGFQIRPRYDLQVPAVVIQYRRTNVVNGVPFYQQELDIAPPGATGKEFKAVVAPVNLQGSVVNASFAQIECAAIEPESVDWWKGQYNPLAEETIKNLSVSDVSREGSLPRFLKNGMIPGWLLASRSKSAQRETIRAKASYNQVDEEEETTVRQTRTGQDIHTELTATDLESGTYLNSLSVELGQPTPIGLADYLYAATSILHYDGGFTLSEDECSGQVGLGNVVCLAGGRLEWATMDAVVQSITETIDDGRTAVVLGPPKHLGVDDIIELLSAIRNRVHYTPISSWNSGVAASGNGGATPKEAPIKNSTAGNGQIERVMVGNYVAIDNAHLPSIQALPNGTPLNVKLRPLKYCYNGEEAIVYVLASQVLLGSTIEAEEMLTP